MMRNLLLGSVVLLMLLTGCKKDDDTDEQDPTIDSVLINGVEMLTVSENIVSNGEPLSLTVSVSDNVALSELSVEIHEAEDGHEHERSKKSGDALAFGPKIYDLGGEQSSILEIEVSTKLENEATDYHLELVLLDKEANRSTTVQVFEIK